MPDDKLPNQMTFLAFTSNENTSTSRLLKCPFWLICCLPFSILSQSEHRVVPMPIYIHYHIDMRVIKERGGLVRARFHVYEFSCAFAAFRFLHTLHLSMNSRQGCVQEAPGVGLCQIRATRVLLGGFLPLSSGPLCPPCTLNAQ